MIDHSDGSARHAFQTGDIVKRTDGYGTRYRIMELSDKDPRWALLHQIAENEEPDTRELDFTADLRAFYMANQ